MTLTEAEVRQAEMRMQERMRTQLRAVSVYYDRRTARIAIELSNGLELGLHWPQLDADLYLPALLNGVLGSQRWMARVLGGTGRAV